MIPAGVKTLKLVAVCSLVWGFAWQAYAADETNTLPVSLIASAEVVVAVEVTGTDYSATAHDGDMVAEATVLKCIKGPMRADDPLVFTETAWVGPDYQANEVRVLFLEMANTSGGSTTKGWRILSDLRAKAAFFIETNAVPVLTLDSLEEVLARPELAGSNALRRVITRKMLGP